MQNFSWSWESQLIRVLFWWSNSEEAKYVIISDVLFPLKQTHKTKHMTSFPKILIWLIKYLYFSIDNDGLYFVYFHSTKKVIEV